MSHSKKMKRKKALNTFNKIKIKFSNFWFPELTILIWIWIIIFSMFIPWFTLPYNWTITQWIFSKINWLVGIISLILIILNLFILFSKQTKEKIKMFFNKKINDNSILLFSAIILLILWFNSLRTIKWLEILNKDIIYHSWLTFYIIAWILFQVWVFLKIRKKEKSILISLNEAETKWFSKSKKQNIMKLPFE